MDCIDLFKKAAAAMQTDPRYLELDAARRENDNDQELQGLIGRVQPQAPGPEQRKRQAGTGYRPCGRPEPAGERAVHPDHVQ